MLPGIAGTTSSPAQTAKPHDFLVKDLVYLRSGGKDRLKIALRGSIGRRGTGPFPLWCRFTAESWAGNDRTDGQEHHHWILIEEPEIVVLAIEFRNSPEAPYPRLRCRTSIMASAGSKPMLPSSVAAPAASASWAPRAGGLLARSQPCGR